MSEPKSPMSAPPSTAYRIVDIPEPYAEVIARRGVVGTHRHRGNVVMLCLEGSARYLEYDWVARPGDFITEAPGETHTLVSDHPEGVKLFGWLEGATEFYDEKLYL